MIARAHSSARHGRRSFLGALAGIPLFGILGATFFTDKAKAATDAVTRQIHEAETQCYAAKKAFDDALAAFEMNLPPLPACLDMTKRRRFTALIERRYFDHQTVKRGAVQYGLPQHRYVATVETLNQDLKRVAHVRHIAKKVRRVRRVAAKYEMAVRNAEKEHRLFEYEETHQRAQESLTRLGDAVFAGLATTPAAVQAQARMLTAYITVLGSRTHETPMAGKWGERLAAGVTLAQQRPSGALG